MAKRRLFQSAGEARCDGFGMLLCRCGGDLCVCGDDGEDCYGCEKCEGRDEDVDAADEWPVSVHHQCGSNQGEKT